MLLVYQEELFWCKIIITDARIAKFKAVLVFLRLVQNYSL